MRTLLIAVAVSIEVWVGCICQARVPTSLSKDFCQARPFEVIKRKSGLPRNIRSALIGAFQEQQLSLADADENFQRMDFVRLKRGEKALPARRLLFAFKTAEHFVVYYESSSMGLGANALVFSTNGSKPRMVWGGVERDYDKLSKTPAELMHRICTNQLISDRAFIW